MKNAIETHVLTRYYGQRCVVDQLTLAIPRGSVFGLLGRNGAGKTTTIRMLMGLLPPTRGRARVLDCDCGSLTPEIRSRIGYLAEGHHVYRWMTLEECARFQKASYRHWNDALFGTVLDHFRLDRKSKAGDLSRGQRAGLCLALTLAPEPELLILDDPALGLDPVARRGLLESMIYVTRRSERTILFSSHLLSDVERVADQIAVMDRGVLKACTSVEDFRLRIRQFVLTFDSPPPPLPEIPGLLQSSRTEREISATFVNAVDVEGALFALTPNVREVPLGLEDAFISYVGEPGERSFLLNQTEVAK